MTIGFIGLNGNSGVAPATDVFPANSGMINVKTFGATGNGSTDDTAAILAAIATLPIWNGAYDLLTQIIYFPAGTYLVSDTLQRTTTNTRANLVFIGESPTTSIIKLKDSCTGFTSAGSPKAVLRYSSGDIFGQSPNANTTGAGNEGFNNTAQNLTVSLGSGNAGAMAIDWQVNNTGAIRDVNITTTGAAYAAIVANRGFIGPGLVTDVTITGPFQYGILGYSSANGVQSGTGVSLGFEHVTINGTTTAGVLNSQNVFAMRDVHITCAGGCGIDISDATGADIGVPFGPNEGLCVWIDGTIAGLGTAPINGSAGWRNWTNVKAVNFNGSINTDFSGVYKQATLIGVSDWQLTIKDTPVAPVRDPSTWKKIGASNWPGDATAQIQAVLSDPTVIVAYLPYGAYTISSPITIADNIERIEFLYSTVQPSINGDFAFVVNATRTKDLFINNLILYNSGTGISGAFHWQAPSPARLIITDSGTPNLFVRPSTGGEVYISNVNAPHFEVSGAAGVWGRQFNPEVASTKIYSDDITPIWMFAMKGEQPSSIIEMDGASNFEWVGGYQYVNPEQTAPLIDIRAGGRMSISAVTESLGPSAKVDTIATAVIGGITNTLPYTLFPQRGHYNGAVMVALSSDNFIPSVAWVEPSIIHTASVGTVVATATLTTDYAYTGTPVWSLTDNAGGKYAINSSTGVVTVAAALSIGIDNITISVSGLTFGATGSPVFTPLAAPINVSIQSQATFDPAKTASGITRSNNNLTATANVTDLSGLNVALSTASHSTGKIYFETTLVTNAGSRGHVDVLFANSSFTAGSSVPGTGATNVAFGGGDNWFMNGVTNTYPSTGAGWGDAGNIIGWCVDVPNRKVWWTKNGTSYNTDIIANQNPNTGLGGFDISAVTGALFFGVELDNSTSQIVINTGGTSFAYTPPTGFTGTW